MRIALGVALCFATALVATAPASAQRARARTPSELRTPDSLGATARPARRRSELRTPDLWRRAPRTSARIARRTGSDLVVPEIFRGPSDPPRSAGPYRDLRVPDSWARHPEGTPPDSAEPSPPDIAARPLAELIALAERSGEARVGPYLFTLEELRAGLAYLGEDADLVTFVTGAGPELLTRARSRAEASAQAATPTSAPPEHLGRALDRP